MQLSYHTYLLSDRRTNERFRVDLRPFLSGYVAWKNSNFKNGFTHGGESVFLLPLLGSTYMFVQAKDNEIIKKIERSTISVSEIRDALGDDGSIGFASFICVKEDHLSIGSTVLAPRIRAFGNYINALFEKLGIDLTFETQAITHTLPTSEVVQLSQVGAFRMTVQPGNRLWDTIVGSLGGSDRSRFDVGSIDVTIKPSKPRGDNRQPLLSAIENVGEDGLSSFDVRAKIEVADKMADFFIVGAGGIRDPIDTSDERSIPDQIISATETNTVLRDRLHEFRQSNDSSVVPDPADLDLSWPPARATDLGSDEDLA